MTAIVEIKLNEDEDPRMVGPFVDLFEARKWMMAFAENVIAKEPTHRMVNEPEDPNYLAIASAKDEACENPVELTAHVLIQP